MQSTSTVSISSKLRQLLAGTPRILVMTGAGVSAESGVPTFRGGGKSAVWKGMPFDVISSAAMLKRNLDAIWEWFDYRRDVLGKLEPNPAHTAIAAWQDRFRLTLVTQNVDGLHQKAGSKDVVELHGSIWRARCVACNSRYEISSSSPRPDACIDCGDRLRPDVVLFGEQLPVGAFEKAASEAARCDLCLVIGTSAIVYPAAGIPEIAKASGAYVCEVNPERTPLSSQCDEGLTGPAGEILPLL